MLEHGLCNGHIVVVRNHLIQDGPVAGLLDVCGNGKDQPQRIVGEITADICVTFLGQRLILMIASAVRELGGSDIDDTFLCAIRDLVYEAQHVLVGIAEAHTTADTGFEIGCGTGQVEGHHALILVPDVDHTVNTLIRSIHIQDAQQLIPVSTQLLHAVCELLRSGVFVDHCLGFYLVDGLAVGFKLLILRHLHVAEYKYQSLGLTRLQSDLLEVGCDGSPAVCKAVVCLVCDNCLRITETVVETDEGIAVGIVAVDRVVYGIECVMVAAVSVLGLVIDHGTVYFDTAGREVTLEVVGVVLRIPQTPLCKREEGKGLLGGTFVGQHDLLHFAVEILRNEEGYLSAQVIFLTLDDGITHTMAALVRIQLGLYRRPAGIPDGAVLIDVEITSAHIDGNVVITITSDTAQAGILVERITSGSVGNQ